MSADYSYNNNALTDALKSSYSGGAPGKLPGSGYQLSAGMTYQVPKTWQLSSDKVDARTCYVIATWSGHRRVGNKIHHKNPIAYLQKHFKQLKKLAHGLDLIILGNPHNPDQSGVFTRYINNLPSEINGTPLVVLNRENVGQSYGSWSDAFAQYQDFDYYIFIEDDYAPVLDHFDDLLIQMFKASPECGYLCSYAHNRPPEGPHAAISNGISSKEVLQKVVSQMGKIPYAGDTTKDVTYSADPQLEFSRGFMKVGKRIYDYLSYYNAPFNEIGKFLMYGPEHLPSLIYPVQFLK